MKMGADELEKKIQKFIKNHLTHKDLLNLCAFLNIQYSGRKTFIQDKLLDHLKNMSYNTLISVSNKVDEYAKAAANKSRQNANLKSIDAFRFESSAFHVSNEKLTDNILKNSPVDLESEIPVGLRHDLVVQPTLPYHGQGASIPANDRDHQVRIQNTMPLVQLSKSPFYCCSICLHPLSLLIPTHLPNVIQNNRTTNKFLFNFTLTENIRQIVRKNQFLVNNKPDYKWQILLRFSAIDPNVPLPNGDEQISECIPPYLQVSVNGVNQPLWEILPSNCKTKEGKRHAKPVQISDKLSEKSTTNHGYKQTVEVSWWQTPGVFMYYYMGIYLERKLSVKEMMIPYTSNRHTNNRPIEETLKMIQSKLGDVSKNKKRDIDDDDDLVISNVLPINLCCPVGKSRIEIPLRTITCQHLQCFDAHLFLSMNERRPVWKCPVCDNRATPSDLFCDKYFEKILNHFKNDDEVTDVNVHSDNSFVAMRRNKDRTDREKPEKAAALESSAPAQIENLADQDLIVLDSDEEAECTSTNKAAAKTTQNVPPTGLEPPIRLEDTAAVNTTSSGPNTGASDKIGTGANEISVVSKAPVVSSPVVAPLPDRFPSIANVLSSFNTCAPRSGIVSTVSESTSSTIASIPLPSTSAPAPLSTSSSVTASRVQPTLGLDSPSSPPKFNSTIMNSEALLSTKTTAPMSQSAPNSNISGNRHTPSPLGAPISTVISRSMTVPILPVYTPKQSTTSYADIQTPVATTDISRSFKSTSDISKSNAPDISTTPSSIPTGVSRSATKTSSNNTTSNSNGAKSRSGDWMRGVDGSSISSGTGSSEIVRALSVNMSPSVTKSRTGNHSPEPIACPSVILPQDVSNASKGRLQPGNDSVLKELSPAPPPATSTAESDSSTAKKSEVPSKKSKMLLSKIPAPSGVLIPSVTIDLTEEEDEVAQPTVTSMGGNTTTAGKSKNPFAAKQLNNNMKWVPVTAPISNHLKNGISNPMCYTSSNSFIGGTNMTTNTRFSSSSSDKNKDGGNKRTLTPSVDYFKPHQLKHINNTINSSSNNSSSKQQPIDLTGDDDDDDDNRSTTAKRFKSNCISDGRPKDDAEDGQVDDSDSSSSGDSLVQRYSKKNVASHI